jgi:chaperonin GroES
MTRLRLLNNRVVIRRTEESEQMRGAIYIPDTAKERPQQGEVIAVSDGQMLVDGKRAPLNLRVGDLVLFGKYAGTDIVIGDEKYLIMRENEVLGVIEGAGKAKPAKK